MEGFVTYTCRCRYRGLKVWLYVWVYKEIKKENEYRMISECLVYLMCAVYLIKNPWYAIIFDDNFNFEPWIINTRRNKAELGAFNSMFGFLS